MLYRKKALGKKAFCFAKRSLGKAFSFAKEKPWEKKPFCVGKKPWEKIAFGKKPFAHAKALGKEIPLRTNPFAAPAASFLSTIPHSFSQMQFNHSIKVGFSFGFTSGIITTLGLMVGLYAGTGSKLAVIGGIITIAVADAFSDSLGVHISEEAECAHSSKEVWESTIATFLTKFFIAIVFVFPVLFLNLQTAVFTSVALGLLMICLLSGIIAGQAHSSKKRAVAEHLAIAAAVIAVTYFLGEWIAVAFV